MFSPAAGRKRETETDKEREAERDGGEAGEGAIIKDFVFKRSLDVKCYDRPLKLVSFV